MRKLMRTTENQGSKRLLKIYPVLLLGLLVVATFVLSGCAHTIKAIEHSKMQVSAKMSDTIFLDPDSLSKNKTVYVRVTNTSDMQEIAFEELLKEKLRQKGMTLVNDALKAGFIIQANVLYMDYEKEGLTADGMVAGGFGGAMAGAAIGRDWGSAGVGGIVGSVIGGVIGAAIKIETFVGAVDIQIRERVEGGVKGVMKTGAAHGSATALVTEREVKSDYQEYRARIVAKATQTNIDKNEAARIISDRLAMQTAGMF